MGKLMYHLQKYSSVLARYTKYIHLATFLSFWGLSVLFFLKIPYDDAVIETSHKVFFGMVVGTALYSIFGFCLWMIPSLIVRSKKKKGKNWDGVLAAANIFTIRYVFLGAWFFIFMIFAASAVWNHMEYLDTQMNAGRSLTSEKYLAQETTQKQRALFVQAKIDAESGEAVSQYTLARMYDRGEGTKQDSEKASHLYRLSADQGYFKAQYNLGCLYSDGEGVPKDAKEACRLFLLAADQGFFKAQYNLGNAYMNGRGVSKDAKEACRLFSLAADQGYFKAQYNLGNAYMNGRGVSKDAKEACRLFRLAANQGDSDAQYNLGLAYTHGTGVPKDPEEACRLFRLAADQGDASAQHNLALMYLLGDGVPQDFDKTSMLLLKAADQGLEISINFLKEIGVKYPS